MKNEYSRAIVVTFALLGFFFIAMSHGLGLVFDDNVAGLLAATATWSLPVILSAQIIYPIRLPYRSAFLSGSGYGVVMMTINIASLIVGARSHGAVILPIVVMVLMLPALAVFLLMERMLFTAEERLQIKSRYWRRYQMP